jgi:hypothetical protein
VQLLSVSGIRAVWLNEKQPLVSDPSFDEVEIAARYYTYIGKITTY